MTRDMNCSMLLSIYIHCTSAAVSLANVPDKPTKQMTAQLSLKLKFKLTSLRGVGEELETVNGCKSGSVNLEIVCHCLILQLKSCG